MIQRAVVQYSCKKARRMVSYNTSAIDKRLANRRARRHLNALARAFVFSPDLFDSETFEVRPFTAWDIS